MNTLTSSDYGYTSQPGISFTTIPGLSVGTQSFSAFSSNIEPSSTSNITSDYRIEVTFSENSESFLTLTENSKIELYPDVACSISGSTAIQYSLESSNGSSIPSWIDFNQTSGILKASTPTVSESTSYSFIINSYISGSTHAVQKFVTLKVNK